MSNPSLLSSYPVSIIDLRIGDFVIIPEKGFLYQVVNPAIYDYGWQEYVVLLRGPLMVFDGNFWIPQIYVGNFAITGNQSDEYAVTHDVEFTTDPEKIKPYKEEIERQKAQFREQYAELARL